MNASLFRDFTYASDLDFGNWRSTNGKEVGIGSMKGIQNVLMQKEQVE